MKKCSYEEKRRMTFPAFWLFGFLNHMGWPRKTGLFIRKEVVNFDVLWGGLVTLVRVGISLGASRPRIALSLLADPFPKRDWRVSPPTELWNRFDPSKQVSAASNKPPEEVIAGIRLVGQPDSVLKDVIEWDYILLNKDFSLHYHWIFIQGLVWGLSHPEEALARWEEQRQKHLKNLPEMLSAGLDIQSPETLEEFADAMEESVNAFQKEYRPLDKTPRELLSFPLIAARLRSSKTKKTKEIEPMITGGDGSSIEKAVIINATSSRIGIHEEYAYIERLCGERDVDWSLVIQGVSSKNGRKYDGLKIQMKDGSIRSFWFDITSFFVKDLSSTLEELDEIEKELEDLEEP